jgi:hypothetical protein
MIESPLLSKSKKKLLPKLKEEILTKREAEEFLSLKKNTYPFYYSAVSASYQKYRNPKLFDKFSVDIKRRYQDYITAKSLQYLSKLNFSSFKNNYIQKGDLL